MRYFRFGRGGRTLVILPGLSIKSVTETADAVRNGYAAFEEYFTVFVLDRRDVLPRPYPIREAAKDTAAALDALGVRDACFSAPRRAA